MGDFDGNGMIDVNDLGLLAGNWPGGEGGAPITQFFGASVPEPSITLISIVLAAAGLRRRR
jgi:hypothetical protein